MLFAKGEDCAIGEARIHLCHVPDVVALRPEKGWDLPFHPLVAEKSHVVSVGEGYTTSAFNASAAKEIAARTASLERRG